MCQHSEVVIGGCTFSGNSAAPDAGIVHIYQDAAIRIENTIMAFASQGIAITTRADYPASITVTCCDIYGNEGGDWTGDLEDQLGAGGNISKDPLFCDPDNGDLRLQPESPCGPDSSACGLVGAWPVGCE